MLRVVTNTMILRKYFLYFGMLSSQPHAMAINRAVMSTSMMALMEMYSASKNGMLSPVRTPRSMLINLKATLALNSRNPPISKILAILFLLSIS